MDRIDLNDLLDEEFANALIEKTQKRRNYRRNVKCACLFLLVFVLGFVFFNVEQISRAGEDLIYYAFGKDVNENVTKEENEVFLLKEPISFGDKSNLMTLQYAYLVDDKLTLDFCSQFGLQAENIVLYSKNKTYTFSSLEESQDLLESSEDDKAYHVVLQNVEDREFTLYYKEEKCDIVLEPVSGYTKEELLQYKNSYYTGTVVALDKDLAAFGIHMDTINALSDWTASILVNPLSDEPNVYFLGNSGVKYEATPYLDNNSFLPSVNTGGKAEVKPNFMCVNGVSFQKEYTENDGPEFTIPLLNPEEEVTLNKVLNAGEVKVKILAAKHMEDGRLCLKVSTASNYGKVCYADFSVSSKASEEIYYSGYSDGLDISKDESYCYIEWDYEKLQNAGAKDVVVNLQTVGIYIGYPLIFFMEPEVYAQ